MRVRERVGLGLGLDLLRGKCRRGLRVGFGLVTRLSLALGLGFGHSPV